MRKRMLIIISVLLVAMLVVASFADTGAPKGAHYSLNIIGVQNPKTAEMDGAGGVIFVNLYGPSKIVLTEGDEFMVLDKNGTDKDGAEFMLPPPGYDPYVIEDNDTDVESTYSIYVRPLGKPGKEEEEIFANITTCATLLEGELGEFLSKTDRRLLQALNREGAFGGIASVEQVGTEVTLRKKGKTEFADVTQELTSVVLELEVEIIDEYGEVIGIEIIHVRVPIFSDLMENYYWEYDNHGLKLLQVRIYDYIPSVVDDSAYLD